MKFTPGPIGADFSGSIGSTTASRNRFGPYLRTKAIPINPNTIRQQTVRAAFTTLVNAWNNTLSQAQRDAWDVWALNTTILGKDGSPINITGQNAYIRFNTPVLQNEQTRLDVAPTIFNNGAPITGFRLTATGTVGVIGIVGLTLSTTALVSGGASVAGLIIMQLGQPVNPSRMFFKGPYQVAQRGSIPLAATSFNFAGLLTTMTQEVALVAGQFRSIRFRIAYDDGRLSEKFEALADVEEDS